MIDELLKGQRNGFFIECGADQGELFSNSLLFEMERNWTGILIEVPIRFVNDMLSFLTSLQADPKSFASLIQKNRKAYTLNAALSLEERPGEMEFLSAEMYGGFVSLEETP